MVSSSLLYFTWGRQRRGPCNNGTENTTNNVQISTHALVIVASYKICDTLVHGRAGETCSNGVKGIEGTRGTCCPTACGVCGGRGCRDNAAAAGLELYCCESNILESNILCDEEPFAPCIIWYVVAGSWVCSRPPTRHAS